MPTNSYLPIAAAAGANVRTDAAWAGSSVQVAGVTKGLVASADMNKAWRQASVPASALGQIIVDHGLIDAPDDGNVPGFKANLRMALAAMLSGAYYAQDTSATANVLTVALDPAPPSLTSFRSLYVRVANTNTGPVTITVQPLGVKTATRHDGSPLQAGDLPVGQVAHFLYDPSLGQFVLSGFAATEIRRRLSGNVTLYVRTDGNDATADGSANTAGKAFATISAAANFVRKNYDGNGQTVILQLGIAGTYAASSLPSFGGTFLILGDETSTAAAANYVILAQAGSGTTYAILNAASLIIAGCTLKNEQSNSSSLGYWGVSGSSVTFRNMGFNRATNLSTHRHVYLQGSCSANTTGSISVTGAATIDCFLYVDVGASWLGGNTSAPTSYTITPLTVGAWCRVVQGAAQWLASSFSGTVTGQTYTVTLGTIYTAGGGANYLPGSTAGTANTGGFYA